MKIKRYINLALAIFITAAFSITPINVYGASSVTDSKTVITILPGIAKIDIDGQAVISEKPYWAGKTLYVPLRAVVESMGADVIWKSGEINVIFRDDSVELEIGSRNYTENQTQRIMSSPPVFRNKTVMVPIDLIRACFDVDTTTNPTTGKTTITLKSDGALTDLSFLTGSLSKPSIGNSYFGWSLSIPKGSRLVAQSFNSREAEIENENKKIDVYISAELKKQKSLEEYYTELTDDPYAVLKSDLIDASLNNSAKPGYIELLYTDSYDEAVYHRIYEGSKYFYNIIVTSFEESDPSILKEDKSVISLADSFKIGFSKGSAEIEDLSKVKFGLAQFDNYIPSDTTGKKFSSWGMSVLPEWDIIPSAESNPYYTQIGTGNDEYMSVEISTAKDISDLKKFGEDTKTFYRRNFNPSMYSLILSGITKIAGTDAYQMIYQAKIGEDSYKYDERFLIKDGLLYDLSLKAPIDQYETTGAGFEKMLETFKPYTQDAESLITEMQRYRFNIEKNRIGKDKSPVLYENKNFGWSMKFPGSWQKSSAPGLSMESFTDPDSAAVISVEAKPRKEVSEANSDQEAFDSMKLVDSMGLEPEKVETVALGGKNAKDYKYRIEDKDSDTYADVHFYIINDTDNSYCIMSTIPDLTSSEYNLSTLESIRESFSINSNNGK